MIFCIVLSSNLQPDIRSKGRALALEDTVDYCNMSILGNLPLRDGMIQPPRTGWCLHALEAEQHPVRLLLDRRSEASSGRLPSDSGIVPLR